MKHIRFDNGENKTAITTDEAVQLVQKVAGEYGVQIHPQWLMDLGWDFRITVQFEIAWAVDCTVYIRNDTDLSRVQQYTCGETQAVNFNPTAEFGWGGTTRDLVDATSSVELYSKAIKFATHVISVLRGAQVLITKESEK